MLFEYIRLIIGIIKTLFYKLFYFSRITFKSIPKINSKSKFIIKKHCKLEIGKKLRCRDNVVFRLDNVGKVSLGDNCFFNDNCQINCQEKITFGNNIICGQNVLFFDHDHDYKNNINNFVTKEIKIGNNVWIGANCIILKGVTIGDNVVIAAGTIVKDNIESNTMVYQKRENNFKKIIK